MVGETFSRRRVLPNWLNARYSSACPASSQGHFHLQLCGSAQNLFGNEYGYLNTRQLIITRGTYLIRWVFIMVPRHLVLQRASSLGLPCMKPALSSDFQA